MGFFNSLKGQVGRDTGRRISNSIFGNKHAIKYQRVDADNSDNVKRNLKIQRDNELEILEQERENKRLKLEDKRKYKKLEYEDQKNRKDDLEHEKNITQIISTKVPQKKEDLIDVLNELSMMISANPWKSALEDDNKISNSYSDAALKKYEQCLYVLKNRFPKEFEIIYFDKQFSKFKKQSFFHKYKIVFVGVIFFLIIGVMSILEKKEKQETPIKDFFKSITEKMN